MELEKLTKKEIIEQLKLKEFDFYLSDGIDGINENSKKDILLDELKKIIELNKEEIQEEFKEEKNFKGIRIKGDFYVVNGERFRTSEEAAIYNYKIINGIEL